MGQRKDNYEPGIGMPHSIDIAERFKKENIADHWKVDETKESLRRLFDHLGKRTNFEPFFREALSRLGLKGKGLTVVDIGAGVGWTSAILAEFPCISMVYCVDPSENRLKHARHLVRHLGVEDKVRIITGTFLEPNIPEKADLVVLSSSLHHCFDAQIGELFSNIRHMLKPGGRVLIANEHYVSSLWMVKRLLSYIKHFRKRKELFYYPINRLRVPDPFGGEHWRTRKEIERMFRDNGFSFRIYVHKGRLDSGNASISAGMGFRYYHAVLTR